jgi:hypothetical protein
LIM